MGHVRLGELPRTRKWDEVVELIVHDGDAAAVSAAALDAADAGFRAAAEDEGVGYATWLGAVEEGATVYFTLPPPAQSEDG